MPTVVSRTTDSAGNITVLYSDGSYQKWSPGYSSIVDRGGPDSERAAAIQTGDPAGIQAAIASLNTTFGGYEQSLKDYNDRVYADTRTDRASDVAFRNRQLGLSSGYQNRALTQSGEQFNKTFGEGQRQFDVTSGEGRREYDASLAQRQLEHQDSVQQALADLGLREAGLGQQIVSTATQLGEQPADWLKLNRWYRNESGQPGLPVFAQKLVDVASGQGVRGMPTYSSPDQSTTPQSNSIAKVLAKLVGDGTIDHRSAAAMMLLGDQGFSTDQGMSADDVALANAVQGIAKMGGARSAPVWGTLDPAEQAMITGGMKSMGYDPNRFLRDIQRGTPGQGSVVAA